MKVFVYGTLKRGYGNHRLLETSKFLGEAVTDVKFDMIAGGFPVVFLSDSGLPLRGEVYEVNDASVLHNLDQLEGEGYMYNRQEVPITLENDSHDRSVCAIYIGHHKFWDYPAITPQNDRFTTSGHQLEWSR